MSEEVGHFTRVGIMMMLAAALVSTILVLSVQMFDYLNVTSDKYTVIGNSNYTQLKGLTGQELNAPRIYRYIVSNSGNIASVFIREKPLTEPNTYKVVLTTITNTKCPGAQSAINGYTRVSDSEMYKELSRVFQRENADKNYRITVYDLEDGRIEILCDLMDEYLE